MSSADRSFPWLHAIKIVLLLALLGHRLYWCGRDEGMRECREIYGAAQ